MQHMKSPLILYCSSGMSTSFNCPPSLVLFCMYVCVCTMHMYTACMCIRMCMYVCAMWSVLYIGLVNIYTGVCKHLHNYVSIHLNKEECEVLLVCQYHITNYRFIYLVEHFRIKNRCTHIVILQH